MKRWRPLLDFRTETHTGYGWWIWFRLQETTWANEEHPCVTCFENDAQRFTWQCRRLGRTRNTTMQVFDWHNTECWTGQTRNTKRNGRIREIHVCSNACVNITAKHPCTAGVFHIKKCSAKSKWWQRQIGKGIWRDCRRRALGFILVVFVGDVFFDTADCGAGNCGEWVHLDKDVAHALEIRSALAECGMTLKMRRKTDVTAGVPCATWMRDYRGCSSFAQKAWWNLDSSLENTTRQTWSRR